MKIDYDVGDVVVRVRDVRYGDECAPPKFKPVRVIGFDGWGELSVLIDGYPSPHITKTWLASHFRKVKKADAQFTEMMRAMKPVKRLEPA